MDQMQSSLPNDRFVVAQRKVTKHVDRSLPRQKMGKKKEKIPTPRKVGENQEKKMKEKTKRRYWPGTLALCEIWKFQKGTKLLI